jgi:hypothetical protein
MRGRSVNIDVFCGQYRTTAKYSHDLKFPTDDLFLSLPKNYIGQLKFVLSEVPLNFRFLTGISSGRTVYRLYGCGQWLAAGYTSLLS